MSANTRRRKFTLEADRVRTVADLSVEEIEAFIERQTDNNPEIVSVTFEIDDPVSEYETPN